MAVVADGPLQAILERAHRVPELTHFPGVDEITARLDALTDEHPDLVTRRRIGTSRLGDPITMYSIGDGPDQALVYAGVHPNEPIGFWTAIHLAEDLCADADLRATCRWNIIGCIDPDGTRLNEGWFDGPFTRVHYAANFHRPAPGEQVEWSFPFQYKGAYFDQVLPETLALMRVIDELKPIIAVSLHNTEVGGVYYYLTKELDGFVDELHAVAASFGLPLDLGEPETPVARPIGPAVFEMISQRAMYDYAEDRGLPTPNESGSSSAAYAERHGTASLVAELPYWTHPSADDQTPTDQAYQQVLSGVADELEDNLAVMDEIFRAARPYLSDDSQLVRGVASFLPYLLRRPGRERARATEVDPGRRATVSEVFGLRDTVRLYRLRYGGMLLRAIDGEIARGGAAAALHPLARRFREIYREWQDEAASLDEELHTVPINDCVGVQYAATLALLNAVRREAG
ncbi:zinc carboxypeptidase [Kribbella sp. VKM Ac-2569]|uniref:M14 family zinc carboxypeptidase n=1 Tax=Kribbella sp. VKM Ac-2569 TaxID=2512220 RepID=UPI00102CFF89|nr:M14 family zinc carboxypeptidase [Kribbella sp. VKM Ac-2569]RZT13353.1 zinc carboxypeptidase [Kribbella sp. VKM Ac-2569]